MTIYGIQVKTMKIRIKIKLIFCNKSKPTYLNLNSNAIQIISQPFNQLANSMKN